MDNEIDKEIEKKKRLLKDYMEIAKLIKPSPEEYERQIDLMLEDLNLLLEKKKEQKN